MADLTVFFPVGLLWLDDEYNPTPEEPVSGQVWKLVAAWILSILSAILYTIAAMNWWQGKKTCCCCCCANTREGPSTQREGSCGPFGSCFKVPPNLSSGPANL